MDYTVYSYTVFYLRSGSCGKMKNQRDGNGTDGRWQFYWEEVGKRIYIGNYIIYYIIIIYIIYILYI